MPFIDTGLQGRFIQPAAIGPVTQTGIPENLPPSAPVSIAAAGSFTTGVLASDGYRVIAVGVTSSQAGALQIQRYIDPAGTIPVKALETTAIVANTPLVVIIDGVNESPRYPFASFQLTLTNSGGSTATITKFFCLLQAA